MAWLASVAGEGISANQPSFGDTTPWSRNLGSFLEGVAGVPGSLCLLEKFLACLKNS